MRIPQMLMTAAVAIATSATQPIASQAQTGGAAKVAVIDVTSIITGSKSGKVMVAELEKLSQTREAELKGRQDALVALRKKLEDGRLSMAEAQLEQLQRDVENKTLELRRSTDDANRELDTRQKEAMSVIEKQVMPIITQVGKEGGYTLIFRKFESGLVYADDAVDLTAEVIRRLDAAPAAAKSGK